MLDPQRNQKIKKNSNNKEGPVEERKLVLKIVDIMSKKKELQSCLWLLEKTYTDS